MRMQRILDRVRKHCIDFADNQIYLVGTIPYIHTDSVRSSHLNNLKVNFSELK